MDHCLNPFLYGNKLFSIPCWRNIDNLPTQIALDTGLKAVLESKEELPNTATADVDPLLPNICNPRRLVNIATLYMIHFLRFDINTFLDTYFFNTKIEHEYPKIYNNVWAPEELEQYPGLEQAMDKLDTW